MLLKALRRHIGESAVTGALEYWLRPGKKKAWGGPFNGQVQRLRIFEALSQSIAFRAIVETGTFRGTTTSLFAKCGVPVYSVEASPRYHAYARLRLSRMRERVTLSLGDSREFLARLAATPGVPKINVFFYLDAHWGEDLPLRSELETIFSAWRASIVMVDDFAVPGTDYAFDRYGPGKSLDLEYLAPLSHLKLVAFFPSADPLEESGARRGCVVLCNESEICDTLRKSESLRGPLAIRPS